MRKGYLVLLLLIGIIFFNSRATAQEGYAFQKGDVVINAGIGLGTTFAFTGTLVHTELSSYYYYFNLLF